MVSKEIIRFRVICFFSILCCFCIASCKMLTVQEFLENYDTVEVDGEITDHLNHGSPIISVSYNNSNYKLYLSDPDRLGKGYKYKVLIDKNAPDKNYLILLHKPIVLDTVPVCDATILITDYYVSKNYIWVYYKIISWGNDVRNTQHAELFFEDIKYLDFISQYKKLKKEVVIDLFVVQYLENNRAKVIPKINYQKTEELNNR